MHDPEAERAAPRRTAEAESARDLVIVPHTHWDREWYLPFQRFRLQLVGLLDELLDRMEHDPRHRFTLDGQLAAVDDYLEVRPEARERVVSLVKTGRLAIGPWDILMDEFLCSGEQIIRNLERGLRRSAELGGAMEVGYLPDMFGHIAQMPQILRKAGLHHACVHRGVPAAVTSDSFAWTAPDGTAIRARYLPAGGYGNAAGLLAEPAGATERVRELAARMTPWTLPGSGPLLGMYGSDHTAPAADAPDLLHAAGQEASITTRLATLAAFFAELPVGTEGLPVIEGELRSHARANILPGVNSVRPQLKQEMSRSERTVERYAEPLAALFGDGGQQRFLDMAWQRLIAVSGHDSVTGCGCDETAVQVEARMAEAGQLGQAVCDMVTGRLAEPVPRDALLVFNPSPWPRSGVVFAEVETGGAEVLADDEDVRADIALARVHGTELYGRHITGWSLDGDTLTFTVAGHPEGSFEVADVRAALAARTTGDGWRERRLRVRILSAPRQTVPVWAEVPPLGHAAVRPPERAAASGPLPPHDVRAGGRVLANGLLRIEVAGDGTLSLTGADGTVSAGLGALVDGGDLGDTYNYAPPGADRLVREPDEVRVRALPGSPLAAALEIERDYGWPAAGDFAADGRSAEAEAVTVTTRVELRAAEPWARVTVDFDNRCADHRLRLHLPLPERAESSFAEGQFAVTERGLSAEGGGGEEPVPTFPAAGFVAAGGLAVLLEEYSEYELTADGTELALTLLRAVGSLSRNRHAHRDEPAGPQLPTPGAQCRGRRTVSLALLPYSGGWQSGGVLRAAEEFRHGLLAVPGRAEPTAPLPPAARGLAVAGAGVVLSSVRRREEWLEVRLSAEGGEATEALIEGGFSRARHADLLGRPGAPIPTAAGALRLPLGPWEIATVQLAR